jgi:ribosomal protein S27E
VNEHLETFLATVREQRGKDLPKYVEDELRRYLRCGVLAHGFLRVACPSCHREILVAFSCKCRGTCPSCSARRMCGTAAHLATHVLPDVPVRQWVLTAPFDVRRVLALRPDALTAHNRLFVEEIARWQKQKAKAAGIDGGETGSVTFVQRFNSTLGSFVHLHVVALDGVFTRTGAGVVFHEGPAPTRDEIETLAGRVAERMTRWLGRRGLLDRRPAEERSNEAPELSPLEACMQVSLFGGTFLRLDKQGVPLAGEDDRHRSSSKSPWAAEVQGFNVHAGVVIHKGDREGLERLCRYGARPALSLERLSILPDGRVAYALRKPRKNGATHLVLSPVQFLARIAALVPPPRFPLLRFAGVLAPKSPWRKDVVPHTQSPANAPASTPAKKKDAAAASAAAAPLCDLPANGERPPLADAPKRPRTSLGEGIVPPVYARIDWASLLRRTYLEDVLACPCGGRRQILADITEPDVVSAILAHLGLPTKPPPLARARAPTFEAA